MFDLFLDFDVNIVNDLIKKSIQLNNKVKNQNIQEKLKQFCFSFNKHSDLKTCVFLSSVLPDRFRLYCKRCLTVAVCDDDEILLCSKNPFGRNVIAIKTLLPKMLIRRITHVTKRINDDGTRPRRHQEGCILRPPARKTTVRTCVAC